MLQFELSYIIKCVWMQGQWYSKAIKITLSSNQNIRFVISFIATSDNLLCNHLFAQECFSCYFVNQLIIFTTTFLKAFLLSLFSRKLIENEYMYKYIIFHSSWFHARNQSCLEYWIQFVKGFFFWYGFYCGRHFGMIKGNSDGHCLSVNMS